MLKENCTFKQIEDAIKKEGYDGASSTIRMYVTRERKLIKEAKGSNVESVEKIERKWLISLLYKPVEEVKKISQEQIDKVIDNYPLIGIVHDIDAVRKAIELDDNNGLAEGSVNKIKVVKRIVYGRNSFKRLKGKLLRFELRCFRCLKRCQRGKQR